jgi:GT2 family glycosyltransferase
VANKKQMETNKNIKLDPIDVSACIINWNTLDLTSQLIESIYDTVKRFSIEIIVVDNASTDGSVEYIENKFPMVTIIKNSKNVGYGAALNQALKISKGRFKMILNSDVILLENALDNMVNFLENNRDAGAVGPICLDKGGNIGYSYGRFPKPGLMILERLLGSLTPRFIKPPPLEGKPEMDMGEKMEVDNIKGACMLVRREVCEEIGLFDETFFAYFEESDWCFRMKKRGIKRYLVLNSKVIHLSDSSFGKIPEKARIYFENSRNKYLEKHYGKVLTNIFVCANAWAKFRHKIKKLFLG